MPKRPTFDYPFEDAPKPGEPVRIADGVYWLRLPLPFVLSSINVWLIAEEDGWTVVDTGLNTPDTVAIWEKITTGLMAGRPVKRLVITHMHPDHMGCAGWFVERYGMLMEITRAEYVTGRMLVADTGKEAPPEGVDFYKGAGYTDEQIEHYRKRFGMFGLGVWRMPESYKRIVHADVLHLGGHDWTVLTGAGHSPEHASLYCAGLGLYIAGDQILPTISPNVSVWPTEPDGDPLSDWLESLHMVKANVPDTVMVLPSHQKVFKGLHARTEFLIAEHEERLEDLRLLLAEPRRALDVFSALFRKNVPRDQVSFATGEAIAHLNCLMARGLAERKTDENGVHWYSQA